MKNLDPISVLVWVLIGCVSIGVTSCTVHNIFTTWVQ